MKQMSNNNTAARSDELQTIAQSLVNYPEYEAASLAVAKALAVVWQLRMIEQTGCTKQTARTHIYKAIRRLRSKAHATSE